jgi:hypothetical protein
VCFTPHARQTPADVICNAGIVSHFFCHAPPVTHDKDFSPCMGGEGEQQCEFAMQKNLLAPFVVRFLALSAR